MLQSKLGNSNSGRNVCLSPDVIGSGMYGLEDLSEFLCVCYKDFWANIGPKSSETSQHTDTAS